MLLSLKQDDGSEVEVGWCIDVQVKIKFSIMRFLGIFVARGLGNLDFELELMVGLNLDVGLRNWFCKIVNGM